jgi:hypothetical protein
MDGAAGALNPATGLFSREGRALLEHTLMDGTTIVDYAAGRYGPLRQAWGPHNRALSLGFSTLVRGRQIPQYVPLETDDEGVLTALAERMGLSLGSKGRGGRYEERLQALQMVKDKVSAVVADTYDAFKRTPGINFDNLLTTQVNLVDDLEMTPSGEPKVKAEPETVLGRWIAGLPETQQAAATEYAVGLLGSVAFQGRVMPVLLEAARSRSMATVSFRRIYATALLDDWGMNLVKLMHRDLVREGKSELGPDYWPIFNNVARPAPSSPMAKDWEDVARFFVEQGPPQRPARPLTDTLGPSIFSTGAGPALIGIGEREQTLGVK